MATIIKRGSLHRSSGSKARYRAISRLLDQKVNTPSGGFATSQSDVIATERDTSLLPDLSTLPDNVKAAISRIAAYDTELEQAEEMMTAAFTNPRGYAEMVQTARVEAADNVVKYKFRELEDPNLSYEDFFSKYYRAYNSPTTTLAQKIALDSAIENSPHKQRFEQDFKNHVEFMNYVKSTKAYRDLSTNDRTNMLVALDYLYQNQIPINDEADIDTIFSALSMMTQENFESSLKVREDFEGQFKALPEDKLASSLKSIFNEVKETKTEIKERNASHENISAVDPNVEPANEVQAEQVAEDKIDNSKVLAEEMDETLEQAKQTNQEIADNTLPQEQEPSVQQQSSEDKDTDKNQLPANASFMEHYQAYREQRKSSRDVEVANSFFEALQSKIEKQKQANPELTDQEVDDLILDEIAGIRLPSTKAAVKNIYNEINSIRKGDGKSKDSANKQLDLKGATPVGQKYLNDHSSKQTISKSSVTNGTEVYFYDPKEFVESNDPQVAVVVKDPNGTLEIQGQKYSVISTADRSEAMRKENPERKGDFLYSQKGKLTYVEKGAYGEGAKTTTNVKDIVGKPGELTASEVALRTRKDKGRVSRAGRDYPIYVVDLPRGRGKDQLSIEMYVTDIAAVKDQTGETFFDKLKKFVKTNFTSSSDEAKAANEISKFNFRTREGIKALQTGLNDLVDALLEQINQGKMPTAESYTSKLTEIYTNFLQYLMLASRKTYSFSLSDISVADGSVSFTLNLTSAQESIPLHRMTCTQSQGVSQSDILHILYTLAFNENGEVASYEDEYGRTRSFLKWNVQYFDNPNPILLTQDIEAGMFEINHSTFAYNPTRIGYAFIEDSSPSPDSVQQQTSIETVADNTTPAQNIATTEVTVGGESVNTDTGYSESTSETKSQTESTDELSEDMYLDEDEVDEYQLVETRRSLITSIKEKLSSLLFDNTSKIEYEEWVQTASQDYAQDLKSNAFSQSKKSSLKEARKQAEKRRKEILASKDPRIKSIRMVRSSPVGYSLQIEFYPYEAYVKNEMAKLQALDTGTLTGLNNRLSEKSSIIQATQKQAEERLAWFSQFKKGALYKAYKNLIGTKADAKMDSLVRNILKLYNFKIVEQALQQVHGKDVAGKLDTIGKIVYLAQSGQRNKLTSVEELAHVIIESVIEGNSKETESMKEALEILMQEIETTEFYKQTEKEYSEIEKYNVKKEAVSKALATVIAMRSTKSSSFIDKISLFLSDAIIFFKSLLERSGLTQGNDAIIQHQLNTMAKKLVEKKTSTIEVATVDTALQANKLSTTKKHSESKKIQQRKAKITELQKSSSAVSINYEFLSEDVKSQLQSKKIDKDTWNTFPFGLQDNILRCITKN